MDDSLTRRDALRRLSLALGATISAPTIAGMLSPATARAWTNPQSWTPSTLSADQAELVATMAEHIIPATDTPGGRAAGVHRFVDVLLTNHYPDRERDRFLAGLTAFDDRARTANGTAFSASTPPQQHAVMTDVDALTYGTGTPPAASADLRFFFRRMKELTLAGYYQSEIGAKQELRVMPMGPYKGDIPYSSVGRTWA
jgi:hypothetical protein